MLFPDARNRTESPLGAVGVVLDVVGTGTASTWLRDVYRY